MLQTITSRDNEKVKQYQKLGKSCKERAAAGLFTAEGVRLCCDLAQKLVCRTAFVTQKVLDTHAAAAQLCAETYVITDAVAQKMSDTKTPQGLFCVFAMPSDEGGFTPAAVQRCLLLEQVQDPSNVGALLRSAAAFGFDTVILGEGCADAYGPKAVRASMSAVGALCVVQHADIPAVCTVLRAEGVAVLAAALYNSVPLSGVDTAAMQKIAVLIGNEGNGLSAEAVAAADMAVRIPMSDKIESLNAAVAGSVLLWHCRGTGL